MSSTEVSMKECAPKFTQQHINKYIAQLSVQEKIVLDIAVSHLESSFEVTKSIGFIKWYDDK